jgi:ATP-dependent DNA helicase RecG
VWPGERAAGFQPAEAQRQTGGELILQAGDPFGSGFRRQDAGGTLNGSTLTVGTHALIEAGFKPDRLGLAIIDEQHKFGVAQREKLVRKGRRDGAAPHLLVMTATPIPRTLGLTLYGDLDVSVLDELPAGRGRIRTHVRAPEALPKVWAFVRGELEKGRQAYVVYPRVEESEDDVKAVTVEFQKICRELAPHRGGLLHGRRPSEEKEAVMDSFRRGDIRILVATSVIEVGVDVPNATIMLIENAEQFGLAQLHQLRGRIGRGAHDSHCILVAEQKTDEARERLEVMAKTNDGFVLAEADLKLRGPGELTGRSQSGLPDFRFGDLVKDRQLVEAAREVVRKHLRNE